MSAIGMLGTPSEMYRYGSQFGGILFSFPLMMYSVIYWYFPVFWKLEVSTSYEVICIQRIQCKIATMYQIWKFSIFQQMNSYIFDLVSGMEIQSWGSHAMFSIVFGANDVVHGNSCICSGIGHSSRYSLKQYKIISLLMLYITYNLD